MRNCDHIQESLVAVLAGETAPDREIEQHLEHCEECTAAGAELARTWALLGLEADRPLPLLGRLRITGALTRAAELAPQATGLHRPHPGSPLRSPRRRLRTASFAAIGLLVALGAVTGYQSFQPRQHHRNPLIEMIEKGQLRHLQLEVDENSPLVRLTLGVPGQLELEGLPGDEPIQTVLTELLTDGEARSSTRSRALEALRGTGAMSPKVRGAMLQALLADPNPSVRLKAADALVSQLAYPEVQQGFLKVLSSDPNPGLRVRAIDAILAEPDVGEKRQLIDALRQAATAQDGERYVQIRAAEYLRGL